MRLDLQICNIYYTLKITKTSVHLHSAAKNLQHIYLEVRAHLNGLKVPDVDGDFDNMGSRTGSTPPRSLAFCDTASAIHLRKSSFQTYLFANQSLAALVSFTMSVSTASALVPVRSVLFCRGFLENQCHHRAFGVIENDGLMLDMATSSADQRGCDCLRTSKYSP
jgi:hypothetical protein